MYSVADTLAGGLPHSDIFGSKNATVSPKLFAGCHVLHRLSSPRHSPGALIALENLHTQTPLMTLNAQVAKLRSLTAFAVSSRSEDTYPASDTASTVLANSIRDDAHLNLRNLRHARADMSLDLGFQPIHDVKEPNGEKTGNERRCFSQKRFP